MKHSGLIPIAFTSFQICWAALWATMHIRIRRRRRYADGRTLGNTNSFYRWASPGLYLIQNFLCILSFWSSSPLLLRFHDSDAWRVTGCLLFIAGTALYVWSLRHLGDNYSPCYDSHIPHRLVNSGPYRLVRHPMYLGKILVGLATITTSGSLWFLIPTIYLFGQTTRTIAQEERYLDSSLHAYGDYKNRTRRLVPYLI